MVKLFEYSLARYRVMYNINHDDAVDNLSLVVHKFEYYSQYEEHHGNVSLLFSQNRDLLTVNL